MPPFPDRANAVTLRSISCVSRTFNGVSSIPRHCATDLTVPNCPMPAAVVGHKHQCPCHVGSNLLEQLSPFPAHAVFEIQEAGDIAAPAVPTSDRTKSCPIAQLIMAILMGPI